MTDEIGSKLGLVVAQLSRSLAIGRVTLKHEINGDTFTFAWDFTKDGNRWTASYTIDSTDIELFSESELTLQARQYARQWLGGITKSPLA